MQKAFKRDVPLKERDEWEEWLKARQEEHRERTAEIVRLETKLNGWVYGLFGLTAEEIQIIEEKV